MDNQYNNHLDDPINNSTSNSNAPSESTGVILDDNFDYEGYQVVRSEFFAHLREPSINFNNCRVYVNTACLRKLPETDYVQILVNPNTYKLAIRPCNEDDKDAFLWCNRKNGQLKPKYITCRVFFAKIAEMLNWNPDYRYKILGKLVKSDEDELLVFDLKATEIFRKIYREGERPKMSRTPVFPAEWKNQFGLSVEEHRKALQIDIFNGYAVFDLKESK